jgi:hypothetical protein
MRIPACFLLACFFLDGCSLLTHRIEIRKHSAELVGRSAIGLVIGEDAEVPLVKSLPDSDFIVVHFESKEDLAVLVRDMQSSLYSEMYFCGHPEQKVFMTIPDVYSGGKSVVRELKLADAGIVRKRSQQDWQRYEAVLFISWAQEKVLPEYSFREEKDKKYYLKYDLRRDPRDVCLFVGGGNLAQRIKSNTLTITAAEIRGVLDEKAQ